MDKLHQINWQRAVEDLVTNEDAQREVDEAVKKHEVFYKPHEIVASIEGKWPYLISKTARIDVTGPMKIGAFFMMNDGCVILRHKHPIHKQVPMMMQCLWQTEPAEELVIDDDVWMQRNSIIMPNVKHVHRGTLLAVGAVLTKDTDREYGIWAGTPARLIKMREPYVQTKES